MKLSVKQKYFDRIKSGEKEFEYRDAHITFICEETGETTVKRVFKAQVISRLQPPHAHDQQSLDEASADDSIGDEEVIKFYLEQQKD